MLVSSIAFGAALAISLGATPAMARLARRWGVLDRPEPRKVHRDPMPLLGGVSIYLAFALPLVFAGGLETETHLVGMVLGATLLLTAGLLDDLNRVPFYTKIVIAIPAAALIAVLSGARLPLPDSWGVLSPSLSLLWVLGITSAFSILDHMDGLAAGIAGVAAAVLLALGIGTGQVGLSVLAALLVGSTLGFLHWNFHPASIFMGDGGAMLLGFVVAVLSLELDVSAVPAATAWMVPMLVLGVPLFDSTLVTISRTRRGVNPFTTAGKDHASHRLTAHGLETRAVVLSLYAAGAAFGLLGAAVYVLPVGWSYALALTVAGAVAGGVVALERAHHARSAGPDVAALDPQATAPSPHGSTVAPDPKPQSVAANS